MRGLGILLDIATILSLLLIPGWISTGKGRQNRINPQSELGATNDVWILEKFAYLPPYRDRDRWSNVENLLVFSRILLNIILIYYDSLQRYDDKTLVITILLTPVRLERSLLVVPSPTFEYLTDGNGK